MSCRVKQVDLWFQWVKVMCLLYSMLLLSVNNCQQSTEV